MMKKIKDESSQFKVGISKFKVQSSKSAAKEFGSLRRRLSQIFYLSLILLILPSFACVNQSLLKGNKNVAAVVEENNLSAYERDLQTMKTANFDYIFVFRRKDGNVLDSDDKKYVKSNSPGGTNRFILSDSDKAVIAGSRYVFSPENLAALRNRFLVEDFSKPPEPTALQNINVNR